MAFRHGLFQVALATVIGCVALMGSQDRSEAAEFLCMSSPGACQYAPPDAPILSTDVCFDGEVIVLKGGSSCATGWWEYYVLHGEVVDVQAGTVVAYIALPDACDQGYCEPKDPGDPPGEPGAMCCDPQTSACTETDSICPPDKIAVWCQDGETPEQGSNGEWECHEA